MTPSAVLALVALLLPGGGDQRRSPLASGLVRSVELHAQPGIRVQHLRLEREDARGPARPLGLLRYVSRPDGEHGLHVELDLRFLDPDVRVIHVEQADAARRRLVFRELTEGSGRTLFLDGPWTAALEGYELGGTEVVRREEAQDGWLPLLLLESVRQGGRVPEEAPVLVPLAARFEPLRLAVRGSGDERTCEARRADGSLAWRAAFRAGELSELRFHEAGPVARPITAEEYERLSEELDREREVAREASARVSRGRGTLERVPARAPAPR